MARKTRRFIQQGDKDLTHNWLIEMFLEYLKAEGKSQKTLKQNPFSFMFYLSGEIWFLIIVSAFFSSLET